MNGDLRPTVTIEHEIPGRLRVRLSHALRQPERVERLVGEHPGVETIQYTAVSRSILALYDLTRVSAEEIVIRVAIGLSVEQDNGAVRVLTRPATRELTDSAFYAGVALLAALALRVVGQSAAAYLALERIAGFATAGAALYHGWVDYRRRGNIDPEVLTVTYLLTSLLRGNVLPAAVFTWISAFGRHLVRLPARGVLIRPARPGRHDRSARFEIVVAPDPAPADKMTFFGTVPTMLFDAVAGSSPARHASFLEDIRRIAKLHGEVLEGVTGFRRGIRLYVREAINALPE